MTKVMGFLEHAWISKAYPAYVKLSFTICHLQKPKVSELSKKQSFFADLNNVCVIHDETKFHLYSKNCVLACIYRLKSVVLNIVADKKE